MTDLKVRRDTLLAQFDKDIEISQNLTNNRWEAYIFYRALCAMEKPRAEFKYRPEIPGCLPDKQYAELPANKVRHIIANMFHQWKFETSEIKLIWFLIKHKIAVSTPDGQHIQWIPARSNSPKHMLIVESRYVNMKPEEFTSLRIEPERIKWQDLEQRKQKLIEKFDLVVEILGSSGSNKDRLMEWLAKDGVLDVYQDLVKVGQL